MPDLWMDVDTAIKVPVNILPLLDDTDFKSIETGVAYNATGLALTWNFCTCAGVVTSTAVTPTQDGASVYDWTATLAGKGMYQIEIPASGGGTINNDAEGVGWFVGVATGILPWRGPTIGFRRAALNDLFIDGGTASTNLEDFFDGTGYAGGTAKLTVDVTAISGDSGAADNLEAACDGNTYNVGGGAIVAASVTGAVGSVTGAVGSVTGNVGGNVVGSVASVTGAVGSVTGAVGSVTGNVGGNVAGSVASVTGNVGGNVTGSVGSVAAGGITASSIATGAIDADAIADNAIDAGAIANDAITAAKIADGAIDAATFAAGAITASSIAADAIGASELAADAVAEIADQVWDELLAGHAAAGSAGEALSAAGTAGDPWTTAIPGAYGAGTAGYIVGTNVDALISSRTKPADTQAAVTTVTNLTNAPSSGDFTATMKNSLNAATPASVGTVTGNVNGSVGSVTGAVGSVTGNVGGNVAGSVGSVTGAVGSVTGNIGGNVAGSVASVTGNVGGNVVGSVASVAGNVTGSVGSVAAGGITASSIATGAIDADALSADAMDEIWDEAIGDSTLTVRQVMKVLAAAFGGKSTGGGTTSITFRNVADTSNVIVATVDTDGNRSAVTLTV